MIECPSYSLQHATLEKRASGVKWTFRMLSLQSDVAIHLWAEICMGMYNLRMYRFLTCSVFLQALQSSIILIGSRV